MATPADAKMAMNDEVSMPNTPMIMSMSRIIITTSTRLMTKVLTDTLSMWFSSMRTRSLTICLSAQRPTNQMSKTFMSFMVKESTKVTIASLISSGLIPDIADIMS